MVIRILAPFAPFLAEELFQYLSNPKTRNSKPENNFSTAESVHTANWPKFDSKLAKDDSLTIPIQVNGKRRTEITISADSSQDKQAILSMAKSDLVIQKWLEGKKLIKEIYVPGKIVNLVIAG